MIKENVNSVNQVNTTDDLQTQIDNEGASTRHVLEPGAHDIGTSEALVNYDKVEIVGPREAVLQFGSSTTATAIHGRKDTDITHFLARGFTIDASNQTQPSSIGNHNSKEGNGILFDEPSGVTVKDYRVEGVRFYKTKNEAHAHYSDSKTNPGNSHGIVTDCFFDSCEGYAASHCHNDNTITIENCTFRGLSNIEHGIATAKSGATPSRTARWSIRASAVGRNPLSSARRLAVSRPTTSFTTAMQPTASSLRGRVSKSTETYC